MQNIRKMIKITVISIMALVLCLIGLIACAPATKNGGDTGEDGVKYSSATVDIALPQCIGIGKTARVSASASAKTSAGKYVTSAKGFTYESDDKDVATVDENGVVTGVAIGSANITVGHAEFGAENKATINVVDKTVLDINSRTGINVFGRVRSENDGGLILKNAASGFEVVFDGAELTAEIETNADDDELFVVCDGKKSYINIDDAGSATVTLATEQKDGLHTLRLYKTTDETSEISVNALSASGDFYAPPALADIKLSVYGDGAVLGNGLDGVTSGYAFIAAQKSGAEIDVMALPDAAVAVTPDDAKPVKDVWNGYSLTDETSYTAKSAADLIVLDLGANDVLAIRDGKGDISDFTDGYKQLLTAMRAANASADILCCYGMTTETVALGKYIKRIVKEKNNAGDAKVFALDMMRCDGKAVDENGRPNALGQSENAELLARTISDLEAGKKPTLDYDTDKGDISVVLLGGQSNMEGNAWHRYLESDPDYAEYVSGFDGIEMSYVNHESDANKSPDFQRVRIGYGGARSNPDNTFGPDLGMAKTLHDGGYDGKTVFIKFAIGDTSFYARDDSGRTWRTTGKLYKGFVRYVHSCLDELSKTYNVSLDALCWMQGESDTQSQKAVDAYGNSLNEFESELREEFSEYNADFMFYDALIVWPYEWQYNRPSLINEIKEKLAENNLHHSVVDTIEAGLACDKEPYGNIDLAHFDAASAIKLGQMFAEAYMRDYPLI